MEPKLIIKDIKYQKKTLIIVSLLVISLFIGGSFALLSSSDETGEVVTFKTGNFNLEAKTTGTLSLDGEVPKNYDDGFKNSDITLTLTNTGTLEIGKYDVKLEGDSTTTLESNYIRYSVSDDEGKTYLASKLLSETDNIIYTGYNLKDTKVLKVKLWIDEDAGEAALKKSYNGKINVELYQNDDTLVDVVKSKLVSNYSGSKEDFNGGVVGINKDGELYNETIPTQEIREYRYSGPSVNNYVTFNNETWRILGVFKNEKGEENVKIVRNNVLTQDMFPEKYTIDGTTYNIKGSNNNAYLNNKMTGVNNNDWATSGLQYWLNDGNEKETKISNDGYMSFLSQNAKNMIENAKYYFGIVTNYNKDMNGGTDALRGIKDTAKEAYKYERTTNCVNGIGPSENNSQSVVEKNSECRVWNGNQAIWEGKIALLYPSDFGYSANSSYWDTILGTGTYDKGASKTNWLNSANHNTAEWLLSPSSLNTLVAYWTFEGNAHSLYINMGEDIRPTLYLKTNVKITSGEGTSTNPYNLTME